MRIRLARADDNRHAGATRDRHDRGILMEAMHVEPHRAAVARMLACTHDERGADSAAAMRGQYGNAELGGIVEESDMSGADPRREGIVKGD